MKLCSRCSQTFLPFFVVFFVASISAYLTWLTLSYSEFGTLELVVGSGFMFIAVGGTLLHYVISCLKRHCNHGSRHQHHGHPAAH